ncbi:CAP domain-containing protein [Jatrophihabitans sp.]|uniref:CAP domain-containing protein n=1 Tax=Jatrophihabitans sp. TaxID=1932789 RepID=UPI0030C7448F|nr:hypothetical protein [Jatrophihabitans sp.]
MAPAYLRRLAAVVPLCLGLIAVGGAGPASATAPSTASVERSLAASMLKLLNSERATHHEGALRANSLLVSSAHQHNLMMAKDNSMSHQLPGEAGFSTRISRAGYKWSRAAENIGWSSSQTLSALTGLEKLMFEEKAPNDGHRLNILGSYRDIGIDVYFDTKHHKMWFTQDFGYPAR